MSRCTATNSRHDSSYEPIPPLHDGVDLEALAAGQRAVPPRQADVRDDVVVVARVRREVQHRRVRHRRRVAVPHDGQAHDLVHQPANRLDVLRGIERAVQRDARVALPGPGVRRREQLVDLGLVHRLHRRLHLGRSGCAAERASAAERAVQVADVVQELNCSR